MGPELLPWKLYSVCPLPSVLSKGATNPAGEQQPEAVGLIKLGKVTEVQYCTQSSWLCCRRATGISREK